MTAYTDALNASNARYAYVEEVLRPALIAANNTMAQIVDPESLEMAIAIADVVGKSAAIEAMLDEARKYSALAADLRGESDL